MPRAVDELVVAFFDALFERLFSEPFRAAISQPLKRRAVERQVQEAADAASQSPTRFLVHQRLSAEQIDAILAGLSQLLGGLDLARLGNPNVLPEDLVERLLAGADLLFPAALAGKEAAFRVALHSVVQVLLQVGPVMAEWQRLRFVETYELPRRVVQRLNEISQQLDALARAGLEAADERAELTYRDYLLQRFDRAEVGTVRMTTNLAVDVRELFVMPRVRPRPPALPAAAADCGPEPQLMTLAAARAVFGLAFGPRLAVGEGGGGQEEGPPLGAQLSALEQARAAERTVLVGLPGSGKSTFLEWLQLRVAAAEEELVAGGQQAIPLLLRLRQLDPESLPEGAALIEKATASPDRGALMPAGWIERQMEAGRVLFMLDGLDETAPELRDRRVLPWLERLCRRFPRCRYLVSSRPVGYPPGALQGLEFAECDLLDFDREQVALYAAHWCTAVRLARNEPEAEARREGKAEGMQIFAGFRDNPYIRDLARNPLMLSAVCLVNYFEGGRLPQDRALLYRLCVEGLLHTWDQRRGIRSEHSLSDKLRACREVALALQAADRVEQKAEEVRAILAEVLGDPERGAGLLEHIRYRTGLLLERQPGVFAFAHLTFQEYLAACAVHEGNRLGVTAEQLVREHRDGRWREVLPLYCGIAPAPAARSVLEDLLILAGKAAALASGDEICACLPLAQQDEKSAALAEVLADAVVAAGLGIWEDRELRDRVLEAIARSPCWTPRQNPLELFDPTDVEPAANRWVGQGSIPNRVGNAYEWLWRHSNSLDGSALASRLLGEWLEHRAMKQAWKMKGITHYWGQLGWLQMAELITMLYRFGSFDVLEQLAQDSAGFRDLGPEIRALRASLAITALGLRISPRDRLLLSPALGAPDGRTTWSAPGEPVAFGTETDNLAFGTILLEAFHELVDPEVVHAMRRSQVLKAWTVSGSEPLEALRRSGLPQGAEARCELAEHLRQCANALDWARGDSGSQAEITEVVLAWAAELEVNPLARPAREADTVAIQPKTLAPLR